MSVRAVAWALQVPKQLDPTARLVLTYLADRVDDHGRGAWPSQATLARDLEASERTIRRHLLALEGRGLIVRGDQSRVAYLPVDRRPVVWDLALPGGLVLLPSVDGSDSPGGHERPIGGTPVTEREDVGDQAGGHQRPDTDDRAVTGVGDGGTPVTSRPDTGVHDGGTPASAYPYLNHPEPHGEPPSASHALTALDAGGAPTGPSRFTANPKRAQTSAAAAGIAAMRAEVRLAGGQR